MHLRIWPPLCVDDGEKEEDSVNLGETTFELLVGSRFVEPSPYSFTTFRPIAAIQRFAFLATRGTWSASRARGAAGPRWAVSL
jgi:hypothetical protein